MARIHRIAAIVIVTLTAVATVASAQQMKAPKSGELAANRWDNLAKLREGDEVKIVLADRTDYEWARTVVREHALEGRVPILLSPVHGALEPRLLAQWILEDGLEARLNLQLHKLLWGNERAR